MLLSSRVVSAPGTRALGQTQRLHPSLLRPGQLSSNCRRILCAAGSVQAPPVEERAQQQSQQPRQTGETDAAAFAQARLELKQKRASDATVYRVSAIAGSMLVVTIAVVATYYRFVWHMADEGDVPLGEMAATLALVAGGMYMMEMYARFAHKVLWHDYEPGWALHKSHHEPRTGPFELNDIYAVANAVPAVVLCAYGFLTPHVVGGVCFGTGLGITLFGIMYMFFHDGLVHRRFPVGPIAEHPYLKRVVMAHQVHHSEKFGGVPFGMFLGPQELEAVPGGREELDRLMAALEAREAEAKAA